MFKKIIRKWTRLKLFVMASEDNIFRVYYITSCMAMSIIYDQIRSMIAPLTDKSIGKNLFEINYELHNKQYKMIVRNKRGPCPISQITNENGIDITDHILPYMGPNYDWHGYKPSAGTFGYTELVIAYSNGDSETIK